MAQDLIISILVYLLLFIAQTPTLSLQRGLKKDKITLAKCQNCNELEKKARKETDALLTREIKSKYIKNLSESFRRYKYPKNLLLKGWGARGMPFNVLYTPNIHQQKMMKFIRQKQDKPRLMKEAKKQMPQIYDLVLEGEKAPVITKNSLKKNPMPRKYYSLIPQLFVSYGW